jgi:hypothetical protein
MGCKVFLVCLSKPVPILLNAVGKGKGSRVEALAGKVVPF